MGSYWDGVKDRWNVMKKGRLPTGTPQSEPPAQPSPKPQSPPLDMIRRKFRQWRGREPYSDQELIDWWAQQR